MTKGRVYFDDLFPYRRLLHKSQAHFVLVWKSYFYPLFQKYKRYRLNCGGVSSSF